MKLSHCLVLLAFLSSHPADAADRFGRLFTTPAQRDRLDELRKIEPEHRVKIDEEALIVEIEGDAEEEEKPSVEALTVRGLVYRGDKKSTAWINNSNTFEGGLSSQYINIGNIDTDRVEIVIPNSESEIKLNVGQTYDPISESYRDLINKSETQVTKSPPASN